tara:strand:- start:193 stop:393 length:201 start_codon:yes stop_codon:yes gene_type:complete
MMLTITLASALVLGTIKEVSSTHSKVQEIQKLKKELKLREGQIDLLLTAKRVMQQREIDNKLNNDD